MTRPQIDRPGVYGGVADGLSPRVRGIPRRGPPFGVARRSIPACTGNPRSTRRAWGRWWVYPRVYGESVIYLTDLESMEGLSPRVRGIPGTGLR